MVRGRRVRAAMVAPKIGDCVSPKPKRVNGTNEITAYFQNVEELNPKSETPKSLMIDINYDEKLDIHLEKLSNFEEIPKSPERQNNSSNNNNGEVRGATPHKIICPQVTTKENKTTTKPKQKKNLNNHQLTDYFPTVRRSERKPKKAVMEEKQRTLELLLRHEIEEGLEVRNFKEKGRGVVTNRPFSKGDFVVEYSGDLIDMAEAKRRELKYSQDHTAGCYMYYFKHNDQQYCVDATAESGKLGRLVNHSRNGNLLTRTVSVDNKPRLVLIAKDDIQAGEEITYDYGDRSKESLRYHPWLAY